MSANTNYYNRHVLSNLQALHAIFLRALKELQNFLGPLGAKAVSPEFPGNKPPPASASEPGVSPHVSSSQAFSRASSSFRIRRWSQVQRNRLISYRRMRGTATMILETRSGGVMTAASITIPR